MPRNRITQVAVLCVALTGCYTLQPVGSATPQLGSRVAFDVNDAGRFALGTLVGPETGQIEGQLIQRENGEYLLGVTAVRPLRGGEQVWKGEQVRIKSEYVGTMYERRFSTGRTAVLAAVTIGAVAAIVSSNLLTAGTEDPGKAPGDTAQARRSPGTFRIPVWSGTIRIPHIGRP